MRSPLKVWFTDFWSPFDPGNNYFLHVLSLIYDVHITSENPDILFFSMFGSEHKSFNCRKIHFTGEPREAPPEEYDFLISWRPDAPRSYRLPLWVMYIDWFNLPQPTTGSPHRLIPPEALLSPRKSVASDFCSFVFNNPGGGRLVMLRKLSTYKPVASAGRLANNVGKILGGDERSKLDFMKNYRFSIAFENSVHPGYVTEKLLHALVTPSIPVYMGAPEARLDFNPAAFINASDFPTIDDAGDFVIMVDQKPELIERYFAEPIFKDNKIGDAFLPMSVAHALAGFIG